MESAIAWVMPRAGRGPEFLRQRRRHMLHHDGDTLTISRRQRRLRRRDDDPEIVGRIPITPGSIVAERNLIVLRRLVVDDADGPLTLEFGLRARGFARALADAVRA